MSKKIAQDNSRAELAKKTPGLLDCDGRKIDRDDIPACFMEGTNLITSTAAGDQNV